MFLSGYAAFQITAIRLNCLLYIIGAGNAQSCYAAGAAETYNRLKIRQKAELEAMLNKYLPKLRLTAEDKTIISLMMIPGLFCLCLGIYYWVRLIGVFDGAAWRFDLMPWYWRVMACSLAVAYPVAACGIWSASRWGIVLWLLSAIYEFGAYAIYGREFGHNFLIIFLHIIFLSFYGALYYFLCQNKKVEQRTEAEY